MSLQRGYSDKISVSIVVFLISYGNYFKIVQDAVIDSKSGIYNPLKRIQIYYGETRALKVVSYLSWAWAKQCRFVCTDVSEDHILMIMITIFRYVADESGEADDPNVPAWATKDSYETTSMEHVIFYRYERTIFIQ